MAGRPEVRRFAREVELLGGDWVLLGRVADGEYVTDIVADLGIGSPWMFYKWLKKDKSGEREAAFKEARRIAAHSNVESAGKILDNLDKNGVPTSAEVSLANARAKYKQWLAGKQNDDYSDRPQTEVNITVGGLHLSALQKHGSMGALKAEEADDGPVLEGEVVEESEPARSLPVPDAGDQQDGDSASDLELVEASEGTDVDVLQELMEA